MKQYVKIKLEFIVEGEHSAEALRDAAEGALISARTVFMQLVPSADVACVSYRRALIVGMKRRVSSRRRANPIPKPTTDLKQ